jgi:hypothetical protein
VAHDHVHRMLFADVCDDDDRMNVPVVRIRTDMSSYVDADNLDELGLAGIELVLPEPHVEAYGRTANIAKEVPFAEVVDAVESSTSTPKRRAKRKRRSKKVADAAANPDAKANPVQLTRPSVPPVSVLPRRKPSHLRDYVINAVIHGTSDVPIPQSYKQTKRSEVWPEWKKAIESELSSLRDHETWRSVPHKSIGKAKVSTCRGFSRPSGTKRA